MVDIPNHIALVETGSVSSNSGVSVGIAVCVHVTSEVGQAERSRVAADRYGIPVRRCFLAES